MQYPFVIKAKVVDIVPLFPGAKWDYLLTVEYTQAIMKGRSIAYFVERALKKPKQSSSNVNYRHVGFEINRTQTRITFNLTVEIRFPESKLIKDNVVVIGTPIHMEIYVYTAELVYGGKVYFRPELRVSLLEVSEKGKTRKFYRGGITYDKNKGYGELNEYKEF